MNKKPASLKKRCSALLIDYFIIVGYGLCLAGAALGFYYAVFGEIPDLINTIGPFGTQLIGFVTLTLPIVLYFFFTESGQKHASFGKRAVGIFISDISGKKVTKKQVLIRTLVKFLPWEFAHTFVHQIIYYSQNNGTPPSWVMTGLITANILPWLYIGCIVFRKDHRGPHDLVAGTIVTSTKKA